IATTPGYNFSEALKRLDIVWTPETVSKLFEIGPQAYTPGTKMPEQRIGSEQDRAALVQFLERATKRRTDRRGLYTGFVNASRAPKRPATYPRIPRSEACLHLRWQEISSTRPRPWSRRNGRST